MLTTYTLDNGLQVALQSIKDSRMAVVNMMYQVGSRNENRAKTGLAHFLEHVAFGGSLNVDSYDQTLQKVGGKNNAYTSSDVTNYWCQVPSNQLETALYLESDRLLGLAYKQEVINVQRRVVIEEFKQSYHNKPYGDVWHMLCEESYKKHPYAWPTIGKEIMHLEQITHEDIIDFGNRFYVPSNVVLVIVGGIDIRATQQMVNKWFGAIPAKQAPAQLLPQEDIKSSHRNVVRNVPQNALYKTFHIPGRKTYGALKVLVNYLAEGNESLLYQVLIEQKQLLTEIAVYTTDTFDPGLLVMEAKLQDGIGFAVVEQALQALITQTIEKGLPDKVLQKAKKQEEAAHAFQKVNPMQRAEEIAYAMLMEDPLFFEKEIRGLGQITSQDVQAMASSILTESNSHTLHYAAKKP